MNSELYTPTFLFASPEQLFFNYFEPGIFWDDRKIREYYKKSDGGLDIHKYVDALRWLVDENLQDLLIRLDCDQQIDFFLSDTFLLFLNSIAKHDFSQYKLDERDAGWVLSHVATYLAVLFHKAKYYDIEKSLKLYNRMKLISSLLIKLWSNYTPGFRLNITWVDIMNESSEVDYEKMNSHITNLFTTKQLSVALTFLDKGRES